MNFRKRKTIAPYIHTRHTHTHIHTYIHTKHAHIHTYIHTYIHTKHAHIQTDRQTYHTYNMHAYNQEWHVLIDQSTKIHNPCCQIKHLIRRNSWQSQTGCLNFEPMKSHNANSLCTCTRNLQKVASYTLWHFLLGRSSYATTSCPPFGLLKEGSITWPSNVIAKFCIGFSWDLGNKTSITALLVHMLPLPCPSGCAVLFNFLSGGWMWK